MLGYHLFYYKTIWFVNPEINAWNNKTNVKSLVYLKLDKS